MIDPADARAIGPRVPAAVRSLMDILCAAGHDAYVVGGSLRDVILGREPTDWDLTTDAPPERMRVLFPDASYENRFGTVVVPRGGAHYEITTYRAESGYADHRRPDVIAFGTRLEDDLARRDFTMNAMAWGFSAGDPRDAAGPAFVDPFAGLADLRAGIVRAVGDPAARFDEDALRMLRAVRLAAVLGFTVEPATLAAIPSRAADVRYLSGERVGAEIGRLLLAPRPSIGLALADDAGLIEPILPELAVQHGVPQAKIAGEDLWDHTLRTVDATAADATLRCAALLHDVAKPSVMADGRFIHHDIVGARMADAILERLRIERAIRERVVRLVRHHMFSYETSWSDAAVRRFIRRVGVDLVDDLIALRVADDVGSGLPPDGPRTTDLRRRCDEQRAARAPLGRSDLAIDGHDLIAELGLGPGPLLGRILDRLTDRVVDDPALNDRQGLLATARAMARSREDR
jgi:tRNA nucleotidyltransferase (CCA-adding enzyme)